MEHKHQVTPVGLIIRFVRRRWRVPLEITGGVILLLVLAGLAAARPGGRSTRASVAAPPMGPVQTQGVVESLFAKSVGPVFEGTLQTVAVQPGQRVKRGQLLFKMDTAPIQASLAGAQAQAVAAAQSLRSARQERAADLREYRQLVSALGAELKRERERAAQVQMPPMQPAAEGELAPVAPAPLYAMPVDPGRLQELEARLATARQQLAQRAAQWEPMISESIRECSAANAEVARLRDLLAGAERRSPMEGVVTAVNASAGQTVQAGEPLVRVDRPSGYRVVTLVDQQVREVVQPGVTLAVETPAGTTAAQLEKIADGEDRLLFQYYLWLKPRRPEALQPGEKVEVAIPASVIQTASAE